MNHVDQPSTIVTSALSFLSGTAMSRISGLARDMSMAFFFGTHPSIAAFLVAFRIANLLRRIFGEGALLNSLIPHFESIRSENSKAAAEFFRDVFFSLLLLLVGIVGIFQAALYFFSILGISADNREILNLIAIILPGVIFICLFSICSGLLHCEKNFFITGTAPIAFNVVWIISIVLFRNAAPDIAATGLSLGITFAFLSQWLMTVPKTVSILHKFLSWKELIKCRIFSIQIREMICSLSFGIVGVIATQINTAMDTIFARYASLEGPAYLNYAIHLQQLPLALFGIGISSALLPPLSRAYKSGDLTKFNQLLEFSLSVALFIIIPCTIGIGALGASSVNLLFGRGHFDQLSTLHTTLCLWGYGLGLIPMVITLLLAPAFYAKKDYKIPMKASICSVLINFSLNVIVIRFLHYGAAGLALTTSIAALYNAAALYKYLHIKNQLSLSKNLYYSVVKTMACAMLAGGITLFIGHVFLHDPTVDIASGNPPLFSRNFNEQMLQFLTLCGSYFFSFLALAKIFKHEHLSFLSRGRLQNVDQRDLR